MSGRLLGYGHRAPRVVRRRLVAYGVLQAISVAGGVTPKGSDRRVEIKRVGKNGEQVVVKAMPIDLVQPDDVIRVKESIF